ELQSGVPERLPRVRDHRARRAADGDPGPSLARGVSGMSTPVDFTLVVVAYHRPASLRRLLAGVHAGAPAGDGAAPRVVVVNVDADAEVTAVGTEFAATVVDTTNRGYAA